MSTVEEIKEATRTLSMEQRAELLEFLLGADDDDWDRQMAKDAAAGKLEFLVDEAKAAIRDGTLRDWPKPNA